MELGEVSPAVEVDLDLFSIPPAAKAAITDIVLESISNVLVHACATTLRVTIWIDDDRIVTEIEDNGIGGVTSVRKVEDRTRAVHGTIEIDSPRGVGTLVRVEMPAAEANTVVREGISNIARWGKPELRRGGGIEPAP